MRRFAVSATSQHRVWSESKSRTQGEGGKDEKREIMDDEEKHYWKLLKYNGTDECLLKDSTWLLAE